MMTLMVMLVVISVVFESFTGVIGLGQQKMKRSDCWTGQLVKVVLHEYLLLEKEKLAYNI